VLQWLRIGGLAATGLPDASIDAVLCTDAIHFPDEPASAYEEIRRVLKPRRPGGADLLGTAGPQR
jgi:ubiquinone/menaquinone biosynthesis C-methylase UbiE